MDKQAQEQSTAGSDAAQTTGDATGNESASNEQQATFTQADLSKIAANEKREGRNSVLTELGFDDLDELKQTVEAYRLVESEIDTEADKLAKKLEKLSPKAEKADRYEAALNTLLEKEREGLPEHITSLLDGRDPDEQLSWIAENREAIAEAQRPATVGRGSAPGSVGRVGLDFTNMSQAEFDQLQARVRAGEVITP